MSLPVILLVVAGLLVVVSLLQRLAARVALPASILFAVMGMTIGGAAMLALRDGATGMAGEIARAFVDVPVTSETFMFVFVPALLFQAALTIDVKRMIDDVAPILLLAVVAVLVATAVIGLAVAPVAEVSLVACLLLASIVATTDTGAVVGIFRDVGAPARLCRLVEGESLLNDAAAIITFAVLLDMLTGADVSGPTAAVLRFLWTFTGGLAVGYIGARLVVGLLPWLQELRLAQATMTLALPYLVYIIGERGLAVSGVTAAVTAGLVMSATAPARIAPAAWRFLLDLWEQLAYWANSLVFVLAALLVPRLLVDIGWSDVITLTVMIVASLVARAFMLWGFFPAADGRGPEPAHRHSIQHRHSLGRAPRRGHARARSGHRRERCRQLRSPPVRGGERDGLRAFHAPRAGADPPSAHPEARPRSAVRVRRGAAVARADDVARTGRRHGSDDRRPLRLQFGTCRPRRSRRTG